MLTRLTYFRRHVYSIYLREGEGLTFKRMLLNPTSNKRLRVVRTCSRLFYSMSLGRVESKGVAVQSPISEMII